MTAPAKGLTLRELLDGDPPATLSVPVAAATIGISASHFYALLAQGEAPVKTIQAGSRARVITAALIEALAAK